MPDIHDFFLSEIFIWPKEQAAVPCSDPCESTQCYLFSTLARLAYLLAIWLL